MVPDLARARAYALDRLSHELSPRLTYHSFGHTRDDVLPAALRLAAAAGISGEAQLLLETAALYHDLGFVVQRDDHERVSIALAEAVLPGFGYTPGQREVIRDLINATRLPQTPRSFLAEILTDADLDVLGRADYWPRSDDLRAEWAAYGVRYTDHEWYQSQVDFLTSQHYFTPMARALRNAQKQVNLAGLVAELAGLDGRA
ncbi:MAG: hypothetical protein IT317_08465 [Anaerolineales bacterium]|nr:hypothetical protein [Anaerolineales bacterium]